MPTAHAAMMRAFEEPVRIALEVVAILERARLALVDVDRHQARRRLGRHELPLAAGRETGAAEAAQPRVLHHRDRRQPAFAAPLTHDGRERVATCRAIRGVVDVARRDRDVRRRSASPRPAFTSATTFSAVACGTGFCPTTATGAVSQRPTHGACSTRTPVPSSAGSSRAARASRRARRQSSRRRAP